jgi:hypothetical protein
LLVFLFFAQVAISAKLLKLGLNVHYDGDNLGLSLNERGDIDI